MLSVAKRSNVLFNWEKKVACVEPWLKTESEKAQTKASLFKSDSCAPDVWHTEPLGGAIAADSRFSVRARPPLPVESFFIVSL